MQKSCQKKQIKRRQDEIYLGILSFSSELNRDLNLSSLKKLSDNENRNTSLLKQLTDPRSDTQDSNTTTNTSSIADTPILILLEKNCKENLTQRLIFNPYAKTNKPDHQKTNQNTSNHYKSITPNRKPHENTYNPMKQFFDMKISSHKNQTLQNNQQLQTSNTPSKKSPIYSLAWNAYNQSSCRSTVH
jgi:hypothetical protein